MTANRSRQPTSCPTKSVLPGSGKSPTAQDHQVGEGSHTCLRPPLGATSMKGNNTMTSPPPAPSPPTLLANSDLCICCLDIALHGDSLCTNCSNWREILGAPPIGVTSMCLYNRQSPIRELLVGYKDPTNPQRKHQTTTLINLLYTWIGTSTPLDRTLPDGVDGCVVVPSTKRRRSYLGEALSKRPLPRYGQSLDVLQATPHQPEQRLASTTRFTTTQQLTNKRLVLIDDVYTTGATAQSAAHTLQAAGADVTSIIVVGRRINPHALAELGHAHPAMSREVSS